ncbi:energy transducer TonB [Alloprevotella rava]|nr:energy transducer TonB [Alloprevotella rava]MBB3702643.1 TonB family protein [Alloprevotella rava]
MRYILFVFTLLFSQLVFAQKLQTFDGPYEDGRALYTFYEGKDGSFVLHGTFTFKKLNYTITGGFKHNRMDGCWRGHYLNKKSGKEYKETIYFKRGVVDGAYKLIFQTPKRLERVQAMVRNNRFVGAATRILKGDTISIIFDGNGFPDGQWRRQDTYYTYTEDYSHGLFLKSLYIDNRTGEKRAGGNQDSEISAMDFLQAYDSIKQASVVNGKEFVSDVRKEHKGLLELAFYNYGCTFRYLPNKLKSEIENLPYNVPFIHIRSKSGYTSWDALDKKIEETEASFPGGYREMMNFMINEMRYPQTVKEDVEGKVVVRFTVNEDGTISDVKIVRSLSPEADQEVMRVISKMPRWTPKMVNKTPVKSDFTLPITFKLK